MKCSVGSCDGERHGKSVYCSSHYQRARLNNGDPLIDKPIVRRMTGKPSTPILAARARIRTVALAQDEHAKAMDRWRLACAHSDECLLTFGETSGQFQAAELAEARAAIAVWPAAVAYGRLPM
jgi:hypothetical protein